MKAFEKRARSAFATLLSAALIVSGAVFASPAAYAEDQAPEVAPVAEVVEEAPADATSGATPEAADSELAEGASDGVSDASLAEAPEANADDEAAHESSDSAAPAVNAPQQKLRSLSVAPVGPQLSVSKTEGLDPAGDSITVIGTGFDASFAGLASYYGCADPTNAKKGFYVQLGWIKDSWRPSEGGANNVDRKGGPNSWFADDSNCVAPSKWTIEEDGTASFTYTFEDVTQAALGELTEGARYAVFTSGAGGGTQAVNEVAVEISFAEPAPVGPQLSVSKTEGLDPAGDSITVIGTGFDASFAGLASYYGCADPTNAKKGFYVQLGWIKDSWRPSEGGANNVDRKGGPNSWFADDSNCVAPSKWTIEEDGTASFTYTFEDVTQAALGELTEGARYAVFTSGAGGGTQAVNEVAVEISFAEPAPVGPQLSVSKTEGLDPAGDSITVIGTGFDASFAGLASYYGCADPTNAKKGFYVQLGWIKDSWRPSEGGANNVDRKGGPNSWFADDSNCVAPSKWTIEEDGTASFTYTFEDVTQAALGELTEGARYAVFTSGAGGGTQAVNEVAVEISFAEPAPVGPNVAIQGVAVAADGLKVDVNVSGLMSQVYAALIVRGTESDLSQTGGGYAAFAYEPAQVNGVATFSLVAPVDKLDRTKEYEVLVWRSHSEASVPANIIARGNVNVTDAQWDQLQGVKPTPAPTPAPAPVSPVAGSLTWGVSSGFYEYTTDPARPAKGEVRTSGVGGGAGGYVFPQATGSSWNAETRTGTVRYSGSVTFWGHGGAMNTTFANPVITVNSPISGSITANGTTYVLGLASAGFTANADGSITWSNVPVLGGVSGGGNGGGGGFGMDNLTFTVGVASAANYGSTVTTSPAAQTRTPAAAAPASTGITVVTPPQQLAAGGEIEITASGFQPNETGILVVIYSEPTVLDTNAKADANGVVRWIGTLPEGLTGKHTITMQGSINVGQEITIVAADETKAAGKSATVTETAETTAGAATPISDGGTPAWAWWTGALALLLIAGASTGLVVAQRRKAEHTVTEL